VGLLMGATAMRYQHTRFLALLLFGAFGDPAAAQEGKDMHLEDAGFLMRTADTSEKLSHAKLLPPRKFVARVKDGKRYYVYADPELCKCVFVGDETAMKTFRDMQKRPQLQTTLAPGITPEGEMIQDMDRDVSDQIDDGNILDYKF
jgi:hypothetical protein